MASALRLLPFLLVACAAAVLLAPAPSASAPSVASRTAPQSPESEPLFERPLPTLVGRKARAKPAAEAPEHGPAVIVVRGPNGPRKGIWLDVYGTEEDGHDWEKTDGNGCVRLADVPYDGSVTVIVDALPATPVEGGISRATAKVLGPRTHILTTDRMKLEATFRDAETGSPVGPPSTRSFQTRPGSYVYARLKVEPPPGLVAFDGLSATADVSRRATSLRMEGILRREARVSMHAVDVDGHWVGDAEVRGIEVAGEEVQGVRGGARDGELVRVRGVPFLRGERIRLLATRPTLREIDEEEEIEEEYDADSYYDSDGLRPLLPDDAWETWGAFEPGEAAIAKARLPESIGRHLVLRAVFDPEVQMRSVDMGRCFGSGSGSCRRIAGPRGDVGVEVVDRQGRPIRGARVDLRGRWLRTDLEGRARFHEVPAGERRITLREPGWVRTRHVVVVQGGKTVSTRLVEDEGGTLKVRVLGDDGLPLAGAWIAVPDWSAWADVSEDGVQRIDVATDHRGERLLHRFPPGKVRIEARWGRREDTGEVVVVSGQQRTLEIRLAPDPD